ncbi:hypothetical protein V492_04744, partial [Pseudogymnoascus sp. VKM F-4246]
IAGSDRCPHHVLTTAAQINSTTYRNTTAASAPFYSTTIPPLFHGVIPDPMVTYHNAPALYEYAAYATLHNSSVAATLPAASLARMRALAGKRVWGIHGVRSGSVSGEEVDSEEAGFFLRAVCGVRGCVGAGGSGCKV